MQVSDNNTIGIGHKNGVNIGIALEQICFTHCILQNKLEKHAVLHHFRYHLKCGEKRPHEESSRPSTRKKQVRIHTKE